MRVVYGLIAAAVWLTATSSVLSTLVVPRGMRRGLTSSVLAGVRGVFTWVAGRFRSYETSDRVLAAEGPSVLVAQLLMWLGLYLLGYWLLVAAVTGDGLGSAAREAASSLFTLGFAGSPTAGSTVVDVAAAATGPVVIALQIAYLPTLYDAFNRRETDVTLLSSRAGDPPWGPELLMRHQLVGLVGSLPAYYAAWERWAADIAESHTNYPALVTFRSPKPERSWVVGLLAVLDSAALYLALCPTQAPKEARLCLRMGFLCLRDVARVAKIPAEADPRPDQPIALRYDEFRDAVARMAAVGFPMERSAAEAWPHFRGWRVNYESIAYQLGDQLTAVPALWSGPRHGIRQAVMPPARPTDRRPKDASYDVR